MTTADRLLTLPLTFRAELLQRVTLRLRAGECCSLVGTGGVGKTNLARFLLHPDVQAHYFDDRPTWAVLIDSNGFADHTHGQEFAVLELIAHRLIREAERRGLPESFIAALDRLHSTLLNQGNKVLALRYLERICGRLCHEHGLRLVLIFDQFEDIWRELEARLFLNLRYLRDEHKYQLVYLTITRERLQRSRQRTRDDLLAVEAFWELFGSEPVGLGMYSEADARFMLERMAQRHAQPLDEALVRAAIEVSGRHPALLRAFYLTLARGVLVDDPEGLAALPELNQECAKLWHDLLPAEQRLVRALAAGHPVAPADSETLAELRLTDLVRGDPPQLFAPLFAAYVRHQGEPDATGVIVDRRQRRVWVDGQLLAGQLPPLEFTLLAYLASRASEVCRRDEILAVLYPEERLEANDDRIDTLLKRLRDSIGDNGRSPRHLITHRGVGVRLAQGRIEG